MTNFEPRQRSEEKRLGRATLSPHAHLTYLNNAVVCFARKPKQQEKTAQSLQPLERRQFIHRILLLSMERAPFGWCCIRLPRCAQTSFAPVTREKKGRERWKGNFPRVRVPSVSRLANATVAASVCFPRQLLTLLCHRPLVACEVATCPHCASLCKATRRCSSSSPANFLIASHATHSPSTCHVLPVLSRRVSAAHSEEQRTIAD